MHDRAGLLPEWAVTELRRPVGHAGDLHERIMARVRAAEPPALRATGAAATVSTRGGRGAPRRGRGVAVSGTLVAIAASLAWMSVAPSALPSRSELVPRLRDGAVGRALVLGDTVDSALHDTLRLVRFVLHAPAATRVAIAGDFNGWSRTATPLTYTSGTGNWEAVVALDRGRGSYAFVVDDTQWVRGDLGDVDGRTDSSFRINPAGGDST